MNQARTATTTRTSVTLVLGDITGWQRRLVYRSAGPVEVTVSGDGRFARLPVRGEQRVGALVTPEGHQPVVYLGPDLPGRPLNHAQGWRPVDMPVGVISDAVQTTVLALAQQDGTLVGYCKTVWARRPYRPMERFDLPVSNPMDSPTTVLCRVLRAGADPFQSAPDKHYLVVAVDDSKALLQHGWEPQEWVNLLAQDWSDLDALSHCIETESLPLLGTAIISRVTLRDLEHLDAAALHLLPADVREGLERALIGMPA